MYLKSAKMLAVLLLLGSATACSQNVAEKYWQDKVVKSLFGQEYVNLRLEIDEYSVCNGREFDILPTVSIDIHLTPKELYINGPYCSLLMTEDSIFVHHFQDGNYTYGRTTKIKSNWEKFIYAHLFDRNYDHLLELMPFYLNPRDKKSFKVKEFTHMDFDENLTILQYSTRKPWKDKFPDGAPIENKENIVAWVDDATGIITRVRQTIHMTSEGIAPADDIIDIRIRDIHFEKVDIDESLYRKNPSKNTSIAFYNMNKDECSPSIVSIQKEENQDVFLDAPLINANLDTTTLRSIEGWVLVDIWTFGCKPCARFAKQMEQEQAELGYRKLEHEGIKVVCLNPDALITESFKAYVERFKIQDIAYSARAIDGYMHTECYPYYFLLSPDKKIVYRGNNLGENYENILKAKKEHSKR